MTLSSMFLVCADKILKQKLVIFIVNFQLVKVNFEQGVQGPVSTLYEDPAGFKLRELPVFGLLFGGWTSKKDVASKKLGPPP